MRYAIVVAAVLAYAPAALAWVESHSGSGDIRIVAHSADVTIEGDFATTQVSLTFTNRGAAKDGAVYRFSADPYAAATGLEVKIGKSWERGVASKPVISE